MNYTDSIFIILFIVLALLVQPLTRLGARGAAFRETILTLASWVVILSWGMFDFTLFITLALANYLISLGIDSGSPKRTRRLVGIAAILNIAVLVLFKSGLGAGSGAMFQTGIPLAISFYIFHILSYLIDLKNGKSRRMSLAHYLFYLSFFPHVIAGPIIRSWQLAPQLGKNLKRSGNLRMGLYAIIVGFSLKILAADLLAQATEHYWTQAGVDAASALECWIVAFLYYCQIYADFAGYSLIAIGMARVLGYKFPANFRSPMRAKTLKEFWTRWHITLSRWLRDYLYIPLGGNRHGRLRNSFTVMITLLLGGLWHGMSFTFLLWGFMHGAGLVIERALRSVIRIQSKILSASGWLITQVWITCAWVYFHAPDTHLAHHFFAKMFSLHQEGAFAVTSALLAILPLALLPVAHNIAPKIARYVPHASRIWLQGITAGILLAAVMLFKTTSHEFIYFRF